MTMRSSAVPPAALALALAALAPPAQAGGLFVPGYGSQAQPRAGAFTAKADDPSAIYYNPAGLAKQRGTSVHLGINFLKFDTDYTRAGVYEAPEPGEGTPPSWTGDAYPTVSNDAKPELGFGRFQGVPLIAVTTDFGWKPPLVVGFAILADQGYPGRSFGAGYRFEDPNTPPPPSRYDTVTQEVTVAAPTIGAGYAITPQLDVGAKLGFALAEVKGSNYLWGIRNYREQAADDGLFKLDVKQNFVPVWGLGALYRPHPNLELAAAYHSEKKFNFKGNGQATLGSGLGLGPDMPDMIVPVADSEAKCAKGGTIAALKTCVDFTLPQAVTVAGRYIFRDEAGAEKGDVEADVQWENWSAASDIKVTVDGKSGLTGLFLNPVLVRHGFEDTYSVRLGGAWAFPLPAAQKLIARAGAAYDSAAAPNSWTRLDIDGLARTTLGGGLALETGKTRFEIGAGVVLESARDVPSCEPDTDMLGCPNPSAGGTETPFDKRNAPDPAQPLAGNPAENPFNGGHYDQGYVLMSAGVTQSF